MTPSASLRDLLADRGNLIVFGSVALFVGVGYSVMLPFAYTQRITFRNWQHLDTRYIAFSVAFGLVTGWLLMSQTYAIRRVVRTRGGMIGGAGFVAGLLPSLLCCSPIVPTLLGFVGLTGTSLSRVSGRTQYFFATRENLILGASLGLMVLACVWSTRRILRAPCFDADKCVLPPVASQMPGSADCCEPPNDESSRHHETAGSGLPRGAESHLLSHGPRHSRVCTPTSQRLGVWRVCCAGDGAGVAGPLRRGALPSPHPREYLPPVRDAGWTLRSRYRNDQGGERSRDNSEYW